MSWGARAGASGRRADLTFRAMTRPEVDTLVEWAADEGWNPGLDDAEVLWENDPQAFVAAELDGEVVGGGAITSYGGRYGFMGFFIVRPSFRGRGLGEGVRPRPPPWDARGVWLRPDVPRATAGAPGARDLRRHDVRGGLTGRCHPEPSGAIDSEPSGERRYNPRDDA